MKFTDSPVGRRVEGGMPLHLQGVLMTTQFHQFRHQQQPGNPIHRASSLEMLNNTEFEEKRAFIASTLSLNDLLKPADYRATPPPGQSSQFQAPAFPPNSATYSTNFQQNGYVVPGSLLKQHNQQHNPINPNANGYNVNFLNNGVPDKELGKLEVSMFSLVLPLFFHLPSKRQWPRDDKKFHGSLEDNYQELEMVSLNIIKG